jgi:hypothetical protein
MDSNHQEAGKSPPDRDSQESAVRELTSRQQAASYLRAARMTDDAAERESLRRKAAGLLAPPRRPVTPVPGPEVPEERGPGR